MLKEQVAKILTDLRNCIETEHYDFHYDAKIEAEDQIINLFKAEVDKLTVIPDGEINQIEVDDPTLDMSFYDDYYDETNLLLKAQ